MIFDLLITAVSIVLLTILTAQKDNIFSHLKQNSVTSGTLFTLIQLMIFINRLDSSFLPKTNVPELYNLLIMILINFRPLVIGFLFNIIFSIVGNIQKKNNDSRKADKEKNNVMEENDKNEQKLDFKILSRREIEVARLAAKGYTNSQIAEELFISTETVKSHMNSIFEKLKITSRKELL